MTCETCEERGQIMAKFDGAALGVRIEMLRSLRGMTLQQVADAAGLTKSHVWEMERGKSVNPTVNAVWGLAAAFTVSPAQLLGLDDKVPAMSAAAAKVAGIVDREIRAGIARERIVLHTTNPETPHD